MQEVEKNAHYYKDFHCRSAMHIICGAFEYLKYQTFTSNVVDVVVPVAADALGVNLFIYLHS